VPTRFCGVVAPSQLSLIKRKQSILAHKPEYSGAQTRTFWHKVINRSI